MSSITSCLLCVVKLSEYTGTVNWESISDVIEV
jgi:hypothetical protein